MSNSENINGQSQLTQSILQIAYGKYTEGESKSSTTYNAAEIDAMVGGGSSRPLNEINSQYPLTSDLNFSSSQYAVLGKTPTQPNELATKQYVDQHTSVEPLNVTNSQAPLTGTLDLRSQPVLVQAPILANSAVTKEYVDDATNIERNKIVALGDPTTQTQMGETGRFTYFQGQLKEELRNGFTKTYEPLIAASDYQITDNNQYVTYSEAVASADTKIEEEKQDRIAADNNLESQITALHDTPLNEWPVPMTPGILGNTFEMNGNEISGLGMETLNTMPGDYASSIDYVNTSVNTLATNVVGEIANVKTQCNSYTDIEVSNLRTQTELDLATKENIVPLNEIPVPITALNMNGKRITNVAIPAAVDGDLDAVPKGYADLRYATKTELTDYITIQDASDAFRSRLSTLSDIQAEEQAPLNMEALRITNCAPAINPTDVPTYQEVIAGEGISVEYADTHYLAIATPLDEVNTPIGPVSMNGEELIDLPAIPASNTCAITTPWAQDLANAAIAHPISDIDMSLTHKVTGLPVATQSSDAVRFDELPDLNNYLTVAEGDTLYMPKSETLSGIQAENPQDLNMEGQKIISCGDPINAEDVVTLEYFNTHGSGGGPEDEIVNASGFSRVKVNTDQTISMTANDAEVVSVEETQVIISQPIFSTTVPAFDTSNQLLTKSQLDPYYMPAGTRLDQIPYPEGNVTMNGYELRDLPQPTEPHMAANKQYIDSAISTGSTKIQNTSQTAIVSANTDGSVSVKANGGSTSLVVSSQNGTQYTVSNSGDLTVQSNGILTLNPEEYTQCTTPILSNSSAPTTQYQLLNRSQNDSRYYENTTPLNSLLQPTADIEMAGYTLNNIRDAIDNLEPTNLAQVQSLIANSGFKNKIQSQSGHAQVRCNNGSDDISITANNAPFTLDIQSNGINNYQINTGGSLITNSQELNINNSLARFVGTASGGSILLSGDLRSVALDMDFPDEILTRAQNDARYLNSATTNLSTLPPPDAPVDFSGELLRNLETPSLGTDAATAAFVDAEIADALVPYSTTSQIASTYLTQSDAASTYITPAATDTKISTSLVPYSTTQEIANTYLTQSSAASTYQPQSSPFTSIANGVNTIEAQSLNGGLKLYGGLLGTKTNILHVFAPAGEPSGTCEIEGQGRLNIVSNLGLTSIMSGVNTNVSTLTLKSAGDTPNAIQYDNLVIGGRSTAPQLQLSSGHDASNNGYSLINNANSVAVNTLELSPEISANVLAGNNLLMYANATGVAVYNQFNKATGLSYTESSPQSNEFVTKGYADVTYTGGGIQTTIQDSTTANRVVCTSSNVQLYTPLLSGEPSLIFKQSSAFSTYLEMNPSNVTGGLYISYPNIILQVAPTCFTDETSANNSELIQKQYADSQYYAKTTPLQSIAVPTANLSLNNNLITNLASGTIASGNTSSINGNDVYTYIATLPSVITQEVYTITAQGSSTNGFLWTAFPNTAQTGIVQCERVKGSGAQMITSSVIIAQSETLADNFASLEFTVANSNVRITQVVPYTTTNFTIPGQENIASLTFSQQPISATSTVLQLYKPATSENSSTFLLYLYVDQF